jgi:ABC-2 type transport system ATP-binding protein
MDSIIDIAGLSKQYSSGFMALKGVDLTIRRGEIFALLGPNGAGKTTLISIVCGIVRATTGKVLVDGNDIVRNWRAARSLIGLVPQELTTDAFESVWNTVSFTRGLFGLRANPAHIESVLRALSLWDKKDSRIMTLSGGMKRRLLIAKALAHEPRILFLDEPTIGLDAPAKLAVREVVQRLNRERGVTVLLTTHDMHDIEALAERVIVIGHGRILADSPFDQLRAEGLAERRVYIEFAEDAPALTLAGVEIRAREGRSLELAFDPAKTSAPALIAEIAAAHAVADIHVEQPAIEEVIARFYDRHGAAEA